MKLCSKGFSSTTDETLLTPFFGFTPFQLRHPRSFATVKPFQICFRTLRKPSISRMTCIAYSHAPRRRKSKLIKKHMVFRFLPSGARLVWCNPAVTASFRLIKGISFCIGTWTFVEHNRFLTTYSITSKRFSTGLRHRCHRISGVVYKRGATNFSG